MNRVELHSCPELMDYIQQVGFLPLLDSGIPGYSAEELVDADCRYVVLPEESFARLKTHLEALLPTASEKQILKLIG